MKKAVLLLVFFALCINFSVVNCFAQPSALDNSFGTGGKVVTLVGSGGDFGGATVIQTDGKIIVAGYASNGTNKDFALVRYNTNGTLDNTFGTAGKVTTPIGSGNDEAYAVALQTDGKIVAAGFSYNGSNNDFAVVRYTTAGALDNTFGTAGKVTTSIGTSTDEAKAVAIQPDGKIVLAGNSYNGSNYDFAVVRYTTAGVLDNTFGSGGKVTTDFGGTADEAFGMAIQADGKIVVTGQTVQSMQTDFATARYTTTGSLDNTFGSSGEVITDMTSDDEAFAVAIQTGGQIVVAGYANNGSSDIALVRYTSTGSLDNTFGSAGVAYADNGGAAEWGYSVKLQTNGKILVGAYYICCADWDFCMARFNSNGTLDTGFDTDGIVTTDFSGGDDESYAVAIQTDGKIILAGSSGGNFAVARYAGGTIGIDDVDNGSPFAIAPNPFTNELKIVCDGLHTEVLITLCDIEGKEILPAKSNSATIILNTEAIAAGFYVLRVEDERGVANYKVVKQ